MKTSTIGMVVMLIAIGIIGFQIGATAKYQDNRYVSLLPVGIAVLMVGMLLVFRGAADKGKKESED